MMDLYTWLSVDSFIACLAIGASPLTRREIARLTAAFGICDACGTLLGSLIPHAIPSPPEFAIYLVCALMLGIASRYDRRIVYTLPILLSIDNIFGGAPASLAPALGLSSAVMALAGLWLAGVWRGSKQLIEG